ncbi:hypothetical protein FGO68_gene1884 [Halteria grandinella]|uniref:Uncharacterized protein n=1 Tax=Halteria grandinella TaxID=5974 RepID=A0A8J8NBX6_HALGN|nr:hypothetical protein FGO68_gene1884 [Halteria grandinella]
MKQALGILLKNSEERILILNQLLLIAPLKQNADRLIIHLAIHSSSSSFDLLNPSKFFTESTNLYLQSESIPDVRDRFQA